ncbi:ras GTPase-activating protein 3-like [Centruroides sculpturatus]|uniref:ras GTPase-activating protein 3-like n=1 Tax=Centruroides sculpturatus TaxID=218467 RepID=UPI000C6CCC72|nr:ras GTPase-activating protein 3-like [Centruroides sculpturatus]
MAVDLGSVRVEERLKIKIGEAKNLPPRSHGSIGLRDTFCTISLDQEEIFRTSTIEKTLSPFFGEEFQFEVPRKFRNLSLYVYDRERAVNKDKVLGKVAIKREELHKYHGKDHWFPILPVDANSEVQGKAHIEIKSDFFPKSSGSGTYMQRLTVRVIECNDLTIINGACDPYAVVTLCYGNHQETKKTKVRKKTICPQFEEIFVFELPIKGQNHDRNRFHDDDANNAEIRIALMHDSNGVFGSVFLGEVKIQLLDLNCVSDRNAWYFLQPRDDSKPHKVDLGSLRLKLYYTSDHVFSSQFYDPLRNLLLKSPNVEPITSSAAYILGEIVTNKVEAAQPLVKVFLHHRKIVSFLKALAEWEISKVTDQNTIFRGNTLMSKCMDEFMKLAGMHYLHETLRSSIDTIFAEHKPCEIDPSKLKEGESLETNMLNLKEYVEKTFCAITSSALVCPPIMCEVFSVLKDSATRYFSSSREVRYSVISGFVFLRFFAPAILGPKLFDLVTEPVDAQTNRTLTLISKTIQSLGNLVSSKSPQQIFKEDYMVNLYRDFITDHHIEAVRVFLELISSSSRGCYPRPYDTPIILKEGIMIKRAQGRKKFGIKNFKKRYFCITTQELFYSKVKGDTPLYRIRIDEILGVERLQEESFKMKNMFQVIQPNRRVLYIQANNCVEEKEWIDILTKICQSNLNRLTEYHPAAFINGHWLCCKANSETAAGCCPVTASVPADICVQIDSDREVERIHTIFFNHRDALEKLLEACKNQAVYTGEQCSLCPAGFVIEDTQTLWETLNEIQTCVIRLEQDHKQYFRNFCRQTKYGSEQAPIGDDNYLLMIAQHCKQ